MNDRSRAEVVFFAALEKAAPAARAAYLDEACAGDERLRGRVEALLAAHLQVGQFLERPVVEAEGVPALGGVENAAADLSFLTPSTRPDSLGRLRHYEVLQVLGKGGFGIVLRAFDETLQRVVAVKVLAPQFAATSPARKRFVREARSSAKVRHENVVQVYAVEELPLPYLVMEFIPGETLQRRCDRIGPLEAPEVLRIGRQIAEGLAAAHATGLIHRDVKPANVLIEPGPHERVKLTDFGMARAADDASLSQSGMVAGTPMYMAPEQAEGGKLDHRADLFSLGSVLYVMCTGRPPFRANTALAVLKRVAEDEPRPIREVIPEVPGWLCDIVAKLHAKDPASRFQTAREVADLLADCEAKLKIQQEVQNIIPAAAPSPTRRVGASHQPDAPARTERTPPTRRKQWATAAAAAALVLVPVLALAVTEFAGVTQLFRVRDLPTGKVAREPAPVPVATHQALRPTFKNGAGMEFVLVPKGKAWLGGGEGRLGDREVEFPADFYLGKYEVTQEEWEKVMEENPCEFSRSGHRRQEVKDIPDADLKRFPVEAVSSDQCQAFLAKLNERERETGWVYRLPTEAEWEYACRGGPMSDKADSAFNFYFAKPTNTLVPAQANFKSYLGRACKVGSYEANRLGLFDMHGNVWEWCDDTEKAEDGTPRRVTRGGCWSTHSGYLRAAMHYMVPPTTRNGLHGLRLARVRSGALPPSFKNSIGMEFVIVPKGKSWLGGDKDRPGDQEVEFPVDFYLGKYEVTQEEWTQVMGMNPSFFSRTGRGMNAVTDIHDADLKRFPVEMVTWDDCQLFVERLNKLAKETGWVYRLPKETEWEYACRGGPMSDKADSAFDFYFARPTNTLLPEHANFGTSELKRTCKVGSYQPNALGLFDMQGNVWEWCDDAVKAANAASPAGLKGGSWQNHPWECRAAVRVPLARSYAGAICGLRLARVPSSAPSPEAKTPP